MSHKDSIFIIGCHLIMHIFCMNLCSKEKMPYTMWTMNSERATTRCVCIHLLHKLMPHINIHISEFKDYAFFIFKVEHRI